MLFLRTAITTVLLLLSSFINAAGYVGKDHYLYPIMIDIRHKDYDAAIVKLEPYVQKNDADALFWYGYMKQQSHGRDRYSAYQWFEKSAELGNPYSMYKLSGDADSSGVDEVCEVNSWPCSSHRFDQAMDKWEELADKNDIEAKYIYEDKNRSFFTRFYENESGESLQRMIRFCESGNCQPIVRLLRRLSAKEISNLDGSFEDMIIRLEKKDPAIAEARAAFFYKNLSDNERREMLVASLSKGYYKAGISLFKLAYSDKKISYDDAYVYAKVSSLGGFGGGEAAYLIESGLVSEEKVPELEERAVEFFDNIEHVINFDEMDFMYMFKPDV